MSGAGCLIRWMWNYHAVAPGVRLIRGRFPGGSPRGCCKAGRRAAVLQISRGWIRRDGMDGSGVWDRRCLGDSNLAKGWHNGNVGERSSVQIRVAGYRHGCWLRTVSYEYNVDKQIPSSVTSLAVCLPRASRGCRGRANRGSWKLESCLGRGTLPSKGPLCDGGTEKDKSAGQTGVR